MGFKRENPKLIHCTLLIALSSFFSSPTYLRACIRVVRSMLLGTPACCKHIVSMSFSNSAFSAHVPHNNIGRPPIALANLPRTTKGQMIIYTAEVMNLTSTLVSHDDLLCRQMICCHMSFYFIPDPEVHKIAVFLRLFSQTLNCILFVDNGRIMAAYRFLIAQCGASVLHCCCLQQFPWLSPPPKNASILDSQIIPSVCVFFLLIRQKPHTHASLSHNHHKPEQKIQSTGRELVYQQLLARQPP